MEYKIQIKGVLAKLEEVSGEKKDTGKKFHFYIAKFVSVSNASVQEVMITDEAKTDLEKLKVNEGKEVVIDVNASIYNKKVSFMAI